MQRDEQSSIRKKRFLIMIMCGEQKEIRDENGDQERARCQGKNTKSTVRVAAETSTDRGKRELSVLIKNNSIHQKLVAIHKCVHVHCRLLLLPTEAPSISA
jgi:hypothetical protein